MAAAHVPDAGRGHVQPDPRGLARRGVETPARVALVIAAVLGLALVIWALTFPAYEGLETTSDGVTHHLTRTMVEENGPRVMIPVSIPLAVTGLVALLVLRGPEPAARILAWVLVGLLGAFAVLAMFSIGIYVLPVVIALAVAVGWPRRRGSRA